MSSDYVKPTVQLRAKFALLVILFPFRLLSTTLFLQSSRLIPRRTVTTAGLTHVCDGVAVCVSQGPLATKPSYDY